jgi:hypothetical protein
MLAMKGSRARDSLCRRTKKAPLAWYGKAYGLRWAALRYFNAAGTDADGELGEDHDPEYPPVSPRPRTVRPLANPHRNRASGAVQLLVADPRYPWMTQRHIRTVMVTSQDEQIIGQWLQSQASPHTRACYRRDSHVC